MYALALFSDTTAPMYLSAQESNRLCCDKVDSMPTWHNFHNFSSIFSYKGIQFSDAATKSMSTVYMSTVYISTVVKCLLFLKS